MHAYKHGDIYEVIGLKNDVISVGASELLRFPPAVVIQFLTRSFVELVEMHVSHNTALLSERGISTGGHML